MQYLRLGRVAVTFAWLGLMSACCAAGDETEETCEQTGECIDRTCQADSGNGEAICQPSCTKQGQWLCNYGHTGVHHCDGATYTRFRNCSDCRTGGSSFQDTFTCDSDQGTGPGSPGFNPVRIPFAFPGEPCSEGAERACVVDSTGTRVCESAHHACAADKKSILVCTSGIWQAKEVCTSPKHCDSYVLYLGGGPQGVFQMFECLN